MSRTFRRFGKSGEKEQRIKRKKLASLKQRYDDLRAEDWYIQLPIRNNWSKRRFNKNITA